MSDNLITLYQPPPVWGLPNMSPFCVKLETYLRMSGTPYQAKMGNFRLAPKGKIPFVRIDGKLMGDSSLIIDYLKQTRGDSLDAHLSPEQKAIGLAVQRMVEEHLYFATAYLRWSEEESLTHVRKVFLGFLPRLLGPLIFRQIQKGMHRRAQEQGMALHTREEILAFVREDLAAVSRILGDKSFLFGERPSSFDAMLYGFLVQLLWVPWQSEVIKIARSFANLEAYCVRMREKYWASALA